MAGCRLTHDAGQARPAIYQVACEIERHIEEIEDDAAE
jgi:hypothetical protein